MALASLLIGAGVAIFRRGGEVEPADESVSWNAGPEASAAVSSETTAVLPPPPVARERRPRVKKERSKLGWLSLGLAFVVGGLVWLLDASGTTHLSASQMIAAPVVALAIALLVGSLYGHAKWTFLFALLLVPPMLVASAIAMPLTGTYADRNIHVQSADDLQPSYVLSGGRLRFDFTRLTSSAHVGPVHAEVGAGDIDVLTSPCVPMEITASANAGNVSVGGLGGPSRGGFSVESAARSDGQDPVVMDVHVGIGSVDVIHGFVPKKQRKECAR
jgi:hypothetical protein